MTVMDDSHCFLYSTNKENNDCYANIHAGSEQRGKLARNTDVHTVGGYKLTCEMHAHTGCQSINLTGYVALS